MSLQLASIENFSSYTNKRHSTRRLRIRQMKMLINLTAVRVLVNPPEKIHSRRTLTARRAEELFSHLSLRETLHSFYFTF